MREPDILGHDIVLVGDLNARIFQPSWFAAHGLIKASEGENANVQIIHRDIVMFSLEWLSVQVTPDRFVVTTLQGPYFEALRDLVVGTFTLLEHTPLHMIGMNYGAHIRLPPEKAWGQLQRKLVAPAMLDEHRGRTDLQSISLRRERSYNDCAGFHVVKVEPSTQIEGGVFVSTNDHYEIKVAEPLGSTGVVDVLRTQWEAASRASQSLRQEIMELI